MKWRRNLRQKRNPRKIISRKTESVRFSCFASEVSSSRSLSHRYHQRSIKIAHYFSFLFFAPSSTTLFVHPKMHHALWILNSNHYASANPAGETHRANRDLSRLISWNVKCLLWPYKVLSFFSGHHSRDTASKRIKSKTEYFHYVLQNITHSVFASFSASTIIKFAKRRFRLGREFWTRISSQPLLIRRRRNVFCEIIIYLAKQESNRCCFCFHSRCARETNL